MKQLLAIIAFLFSISATHAIEWQEVDVPKSEFVYSFAQKGDDILVGCIGIRVSHDGGQTFQYSNKLEDFTIEGAKIENNVSRVQKLYITDKGNYIAVLYDAPVIYSEDKGQSWKSSSISTNSNYTEIFATGTGLYIVTSKNIYYSEDDGKNWETVFTNKTQYGIDNSFLLDNKIYTIYNDYEEDFHKVDTYDMKSKTLDSCKFSDLFRNEYAYENKIYAFNDASEYSDYWVDTLWVTNDSCSAWEYELSIKKIIATKYNLEFDNMTLDLLNTKDGIIAVQAIPFEESEFDPFTVISYDNGKNWEKISDVNNLLIRYAPKVIQDGNFYIATDGWKKYDTDLKELVDLNYEFPITSCYREFDEKELAVVYSPLFKEEWIRTDNVWIFNRTLGDMQDRDKFYHSMTGEYFELEDNIILRKYKEQIDTVAKDQNRLDIIRTYSDGSLLFHLRPYDAYTSETIVLLNDGIKEVVIENADYYSIDYDKSSKECYYVNTTYNQPPIMYRRSSNGEIVDSLELQGLDDNNYLSDFSRQGDKLIYNIAYTTFTSTDGGETIETLENTNYLLSKDNLNVYKDKFYASGAIGLFRSEDGITWENLLEEKFEGNVGVINYEFDTEGYIYAYTTMGTFKSAEPVSVEEDTDVSAQKISINIYPNPSSDVLNFDFTGQVDKASVIDLNGNLISCPQTLNSLDISELSSGTYFLKITSNGKTYYRQFVKAE